MFWGALHFGSATCLPHLLMADHCFIKCMFESNLEDLKVGNVSNSAPKHMSWFFRGINHLPLVVFFLEGPTWVIEVCLKIGWPQIPLFIFVFLI